MITWSQHNLLSLRHSEITTISICCSTILFWGTWLLSCRILSWHSPLEGFLQNRHQGQKEKYWKYHMSFILQFKANIKRSKSVWDNSIFILKGQAKTKLSGSKFCMMHDTYRVNCSWYIIWVLDIQITWKPSSSRCEGLSSSYWREGLTFTQSYSVMLGNYLFLINKDTLKINCKILWEHFITKSPWKFWIILYDQSLYIYVLYINICATLHTTYASVIVYI